MIGWLVGAAFAAIAVYFATSGGDEIYTDSNGVEWTIREEEPDFWSASTKGYGGKFTHVLGFVSRDQAVEIIEGNAAHRDPVSGQII